MALIELKSINKSFTMGDETIHAIDGVDLTIDEGDFVSIVGTSGCGKSTLMNIIGLLDKPSQGQYFLDGIEVSTMNDDELSHVRNQKIGFVFQSFHLLPKLTALRNVEMPLLYATLYRRELNAEIIRQMAIDSLNRVQLKERMAHRPNELSGGQRQRVAIARALVNSPRLILADEPTGALDSKTSEEILKLFEELNAQGVTIIIVTHDNNVAKRTKKIFRMRDGKISLEMNESDQDH